MHTQNTLDTANATTISPFEDVRGHWAEADIASAYTLGIMKGVDDKTSAPDIPITFEQMITMVVRSIELEDDAKNNGGYSIGRPRTANTPSIIRPYSTYDNNAVRADAVSILIPILDCNSEYTNQKVYTGADPVVVNLSLIYIPSRNSRWMLPWI